MPPYLHLACHGKLNNKTCCIRTCPGAQNQILQPYEYTHNSITYVPSLYAGCNGWILQWTLLLPPVQGWLHF